MFEEAEREYSFVSWLSQLLVASLGPALTLAVAESPFNPQDTLVWQILQYLFLAVIAFAFAILISAIFRSSALEGRWVWALPAAVELPLAAWALVSDGPMSMVHGLVFSPGPGQGEGSWGVVFLTVPTWSCCCYSVAIWWRLRILQHAPDASHP